MRKKYLACLICGCFLLVLQCAAQRSEDNPLHPGFSGISQADIDAHIASGQSLFKKKCASCHGIFSNGKKNIPNFSKDELDVYLIRFIQQDTENHAFAQKMTDEEFEDVIYFLENHNQTCLADREPKKAK